VDEDQYKRIADEYLQEYGAQLRRELEEIEQRQNTPAVSSLDHRVLRRTGAIKRIQYTKYTGLIAACLVVALLTPLIFRLYVSQPDTVGPGMQSPAPTIPRSETYEILPLSFDIPSQFNMASVKQDAEKTIYHLNDDMLDDVVIMLEQSGDISRYNTLTELSISGHNVFGSSSDGYNLLAFIDEDSDILYVLTCKYDINTLVLLGRSILI